MIPTSQEELRARWEVLWGRGQELKERQERLLSTLDAMDPEAGERALDQLAADRQAHERDVRQLRSQMAQGGSDF